MTPSLSLGPFFMREKGVERQLNNGESLVLCVFIPSSYALLAALILLIARQSGLREGVVEPPVDQRRHGGEAGGDELFELGALDGQHGLASDCICKAGRRPAAHRAGLACSPPQLSRLGPLPSGGALPAPVS